MGGSARGEDAAQTQSRELSGLRPTYLMDAPCLTRNYVIRFGRMFDITDTPVAVRGDGSLDRLFKEINRYIDLLNANTKGFARKPSDDWQGAKIDKNGFLEIEKFSKAPTKSPNSHNRPIVVNRSRHETAFGIRLFQGVPVEVMIDIHREYFTVQFRAYPNAARQLRPHDTHVFTATTADILKMLSVGNGTSWEEFSAAETFNRDKPDIKKHPRFAPIARLDEEQQNYFFEPEHNDERKIDDYGRDCVAEASARLIYDDFWFFLLGIPKKDKDRVGLSPSRFFGQWHVPPRKTTIRSAISTLLPKYLAEKISPVILIEKKPPPSKVEADRKHNLIGESYFELWSIFKGVVIRPTDSVLSLESTKDALPSPSLDDKKKEKTQEESVAEQKRRKAKLEDSIREFLFTAANQPPTEKWYRKNLVADPFIYSPDDDPGIFEDRQLAIQRQVNREFSNGTKHINQFSQLLSRLLGYRSGQTKYEDHTAGNTVLCGVGDGVAIYGSSFGRSTIFDPTKDEVRYFLFYRGPSRNQLARLNRRINNAGEARVFSIAEMSDVRKAGNELRRIDAELNHLMSNDNLSENALSRLRTRYANAEAIVVRGGLRHRIGRTAYYNQRLRQRIHDLRIRRLVGWQTYDEYIARIFEPQYDTYERYGARLSNVEQKLAAAAEIIENRLASHLNRIGAIFAILTAFGLIGQALSLKKNTPPDYIPDGLWHDHYAVVLMLLLAVPVVALALIITFIATISLRRFSKRQRKPPSKSYPNEPSD